MADIIEDVPPEQPLHPNCRCVMVPVLKGMEDQFDKGPSYAEWLSRRTDDELIDILGPARYKLYKEGYTIDRFVKDAQIIKVDELGKKRLARVKKSIELKELGVERLTRKQLLAGEIPVKKPKYKWPMAEGRIDWKQLSREDNYKALSEITGVKSDHINLNEMSNRLRQEVSGELEKIYEAFPAVKGKLAGIGMTDDKRIYACVENGNRLLFGKTLYGGIDVDNAGYLWDIKNNWHPKGTDYKAVVSHEMAHVIDDYLSIRMYGGRGQYGDKNSYSNNLLKQAVKGFMIKGTDKKGWIENTVSRYATGNPQEWLAEALSERMNSQTPREIAEWVYNQVKRDMDSFL